MIASLLRLTISDMHKLKITDEYSIHRSVYDLFEDMRTEKEKKTGAASSGILYADKGGGRAERRILILSHRPPKTPEYGTLETKTVKDEFLSRDFYSFEIKINPCRRNAKTRRIIPLKTRDEIERWFVEKMTSLGMIINEETLEIGDIEAAEFSKKGETVTIGSAYIKGVLKVTDRNKFKQAFENGIGRGKAFGFGLLQIAPIK